MTTFQPFAVVKNSLMSHSIAYLTEMWRDVVGFGGFR